MTAQRGAPGLGVVLGGPALVALLLCLPLFGGGFLSDDYSLIHMFDDARDAGALVQAVGEMFVRGVGPPSNQYRPLVMATLALNGVVSGAEPFGWHFVNILLHVANAALVALLALQVVPERTRSARFAAMMAGCLFALFPPGIEAVAWVAARYDGMATFWILAANCLFLKSRTWRDGYGLGSLAATVLAFMSKESAVMGPVLIVALAWWRQPTAVGMLRAVPVAIARALPWLAVGAVYFALRLWIFGNAFRFFPGSSPLLVLLTGEWLAALPGIVGWSAIAMPESGPRAAFGYSGALLLLCGVVAAWRERAQARAFLALAFAVTGSFALLLAHWPWLSNGEGGRVLYAIAAVAAVGLTRPLCASDARLRAAAWGFAGALLASQGLLAQAAVARWTRAGEDARALIHALAQVAATTAPGGYAFIVVPDHYGPVPFGRTAQGGLMSPPIQARPLSPQLVVQTERELARWPDLFERDIVGRLQREPLERVAGSESAPKQSPPHRYPDRYYCWSPRDRTLVALPAMPVTAAEWDAAWSAALDAAGCRS
jgi:hypothetical protein